MKKEYITPVVTRLGSIEELTAHDGGKGREAGDKDFGPSDGLAFAGAPVFHHLS